MLQVRESKVSTAIRWLIKHNVLFKHIDIDKDALNASPEGEIPEALTVIWHAVRVKTTQAIQVIQAMQCTKPVRVER